MVLQTPQQALRQRDRQVNKRAALLVGNGLTAAAKMKSPTVGNGAETGERVAKLEPLHRTSGGSCGSGGNAQVKDQPGMARSVHQRKFKVSGKFRMFEVKESELKNRIVARVIAMKTKDEDYAREALAFYSALLPWMKLNAAVGVALAAQA